MESGRLEDAIASHVWYHTIDLGDGVITPGHYDLRPIVGGLPWPAVEGKRCLDVGTFDGFYAFEMERRGASEVVAIDVDDYRDLDWLPRLRDTAPEELARAIGAERGRGFRIAAAALSSNAKRVPLNVYDLDPEAVGMFDVVVCGSLLLHLRDPIRALEAMRRVCRGHLLLTEAVDAWLTFLHPRRALLALVGASDQWTAPNAAGLRKMLYVAGWRTLRGSRLYAVPYGPGARAAEYRPRVRDLARRKGVAFVARKLAAAGLRWAATGRNGVPHKAYLARPDL